MSASLMEPEYSKILLVSPYVSTFSHMGAVYVYHDLYGYILQMSPDLVRFLWEFKPEGHREEVCGKWTQHFGDHPPEGFLSTFIDFGCLTSPGFDEWERVWPFFPKQAAWNVWEKHEDGSMTFYTAWGERPVAKHTLTPAEAAFYEACDCETPLEKMAEEHGRDVVKSAVEKLVHHDLQALKLSRTPMSFYFGRQHMTPPYLTSTMPYAPFDPDHDEDPVGPEDDVSPVHYYEQEVEDADEQFDHQETTLSHLLRRPTPVLRGLTYGQAFVDGLEKREMLPTEGTIRVLEIGAGLGFVAEHVIGALKDRGLEVDYQIIELSPALAAKQRERLGGLGVTITEGEVLSTEWPEGPFDLILSNEMIGDLPAVRLSRKAVGLDPELEGEAWDKNLETLGVAGELIGKYTLPIGDAPEPFYLNTGAMQLIEKAWDYLAPEGLLILTEFGELGKYPVLSRQLDHPELSIHFGHLTIVANQIGYRPKFEYMLDILSFDRTKSGLATTRSYFRALSALLADHDVTLEKIGYTKETFSELLEGKVDIDRIGMIKYDRVEDRLMGLVPHEFKALILRRPAPAAE